MWACWLQGQNKPEPKDLWAEPYFVASSWKPCAEQRDLRPSGISLGLSVSIHACHISCSYLLLMRVIMKFSEGKNGYIMVTANGGINQQRVAVSYVFCFDVNFFHLLDDLYFFSLVCQAKEKRLSTNNIIRKLWSLFLNWYIFFLHNRSAMLSLLQDYLMQPWFFPNFCTVAYGEMWGENLLLAVIFTYLFPFPIVQ